SRSGSAVPERAALSGLQIVLRSRSRDRRASRNVERSECSERESRKRFAPWHQAQVGPRGNIRREHGIRVTGSLRAVSRYRLPDLVDLHRAHALVVDFHVEPANLEARQIFHDEPIDTHFLNVANISSHHPTPLI